MALTGFHSTPAARIERLNYFASAIESGQGRSLAFQTLDKEDRRAFRALCQISAATAWNTIGKAKLTKCVQRLIHGENHLRTVPVEVIKNHLGSFLTGQELANLQSTSKDAFRAGNTSYIIKTYGLSPLIARYCYRYCDTLTEGEKIQALDQLMSFARELSALENLEPPTYASALKFFQLVEARNLLRMLNGLRQEIPILNGLGNTQLQEGEDAETTIQRAEGIRKDLTEYQAALATNIGGVNLSDCGLTVLPSEIGQLKALEYLDLDNNKLKVLPKEIGQL